MRIRYEAGLLIEDKTIVDTSYPKQDQLIRSYYGVHNNLIKQKHFIIEEDGTLKENTVIEQ